MPILRTVRTVAASGRRLLLTAIIASTLAISPSAHAKPSARIINGTSVDAGRKALMWPYIVSIGSTGKTALSSHFCGGSLISSRLVLTAAHCMDELMEDGSTIRANPAALTVLAGVHALSAERAGQRRGVAAVFVHPRWNARTGMNDVAILRLATPVVVNANVRPISVVVPTNDGWWGNGVGMAASAETGPWAAGWGNVLSWSGEAYPNGLFEVQLPIPADSACASRQAPGLGDFDVPINTALFVCAGEPDSDSTGANGSTGHDTCQGDSGGPLIVGDGAGQWQQIGVVSYGGECGATTYGAYTRLPTYRNWIALARATGGGVGGINAVPSARMSRSLPTAVRLLWGRPFGKRATGYSVYLDVGDGGLRLVARTPKRTAIIHKLESDADFVFYVAARDALGNESPLRKVAAYTAF